MVAVQQIGRSQPSILLPGCSSKIFEYKKLLITKKIHIHKGKPLESQHSAAIATPPQ